MSLPSWWTLLDSILFLALVGGVIVTIVLSMGHPRKRAVTRPGNEARGVGGPHRMEDDWPPATIPIIPSEQATDPAVYAMMKALETGEPSHITVDDDGTWRDAEGNVIEHG